MTTPQSLHHSLLRPCVLHILRAAGYHSTRPSVLDAFTDLAARYMYMLAESTAANAAVNHTETEITVQDVRMAMQECAVLAPERTLEDQEFDDEEDTRGVEAFLAWVTGKANQEIRRVALEGSDGLQEDYLAVLKKKHGATDEDSRYSGTILGKAAKPRTVKVEGGDISSVKEWAKRLKTTSTPPSIPSTPRPQSSDLSDLDIVVGEGEN